MLDLAFFQQLPKFVCSPIYEKLIFRSFTVISMEVFGSIRFWSCTSKVIPLKKWKASRSSSTGNALSKSFR